MIVESKDLEILLEVQESELELEKLRLAMTELASGKALEQLRDEILSTSARITSLRSEVEELERDQRRAREDSKLVQDRIARDKDRLSKTAVSRDALGIQHELDSLAKRKLELEEAELEILSQLEGKNSDLAASVGAKSEFESQFQELKQSMQQELESQKTRFRDIQASITASKNALPSELVSAYEQKRKRGLAIGRMLRNTCGACNMGLTASATHEILARPSDEMVNCPECSAILVRN